MKESANSKIHINGNFLFICLLIMWDTLLLGSSLHCNTSLHFTTLHPTTLRYTYCHFTSSHLHFTPLSFGFTQLHFATLTDTSLPLIYTSLPSHLASPNHISYRSVSPHITKLDTVQFSRLQTCFQNNEPLHCPKEPLTTSLHLFDVITSLVSLVYWGFRCENVTSQH
jgi:hypothetical protein